MLFGVFRTDRRRCLLKVERPLCSKIKAKVILAVRTPTPRGGKVKSSGACKRKSTTSDFRKAVQR